MNDTTDKSTGYGSYWAVIRRRGIYVALIAPIFILGSIFFAFWLTPQYESTATIMLEASSVDAKVVTPTVTSNFSDQIEIVSGRVMTSATLQELVDQYDPYPDLKIPRSEKAQKILEDTKLERVDPVTLKPLQDSTAFSLHYRNTDKLRAHDVCRLLADLFLSYNRRTREQAAANAAKFLAKQAEDLSQQMRGIDDEIKQFKSQHGDALPELMARNEAAIDRNQHEMETVEQEILRVQEKESLLSLQLSQTSPNMVTQSGDLTDLPTVRAKLAEAQQRYTPDHPEVRRLKAVLEQLVKTQGSASNGIVTDATNPTYMTTASELKSARAELASLKAQAGRLRNDTAQYEATLRKTPGVEREYSEILRRRTTLQTTYQQIQDKLQNAQIAQDFETEQGGERFAMIRAPSRAKLPVSPNRVGLIMLGLVLGLGLSAVAVIIAETSDATLRGVSDFPDFGDAQVLAAIPKITTGADRRKRRLIFVSWAAVYCVALFVVGAQIVAALSHPDLP